MSDFVRITVKVGHPIGVYSRGGHKFTVSTPVDMPEEDVTDEIRNDPWLVCEEVDEQEYAPGGVPVASIDQPDDDHPDDDDHPRDSSGRFTRGEGD